MRLLLGATLLVFVVNDSTGLRAVATISPMFGDPSIIDLSLDSRAITFENPTGARGSGGAASGGRKGAPSRVIAPGERIELANIEGPGTIRHIWMTVPPGPPEVMRAQQLDVYYDDLTEPSISVPCADFFGAAHGRPVAYTSALAAIQEGRGFNAYFPMPFRERVRIEYTNHSAAPRLLFYQVDYTLRPSLPEDAGYLHVTFRRENPTVMQRDFVISEGLIGPGRFLGCNVGVRVLDEGTWYGEGEVKMYRDGDAALPTICGTGLEDYVGTAWGMNAHQALYAGVPLTVAPPGHRGQPDFVGFYRWHVPDPIIFERDLRVTIQQIGYALFREGQEDAFERFSATHAAAGAGWTTNYPGTIARGIAERVDDYCATAYLYCSRPQPVPRLDMPAALANIERLPYEQPSGVERMLG